MKRRLDSLRPGDLFTDALGRQWRYDGPAADEPGVCWCVLVDAGARADVSIGAGEPDRFLASVEVEHG